MDKIKRGLFIFKKKKKKTGCIKKNSVARKRVRTKVRTAKFDTNLLGKNILQMLIIIQILTKNRKVSLIKKLFHLHYIHFPANTTDKPFQNNLKINIK